MSANMTRRTKQIKPGQKSKSKQKKKTKKTTKAQPLAVVAAPKRSELNNVKTGLCHDDKDDEKHSQSATLCKPINISSSKREPRGLSIVKKRRFESRAIFKNRVALPLLKRTRQLNEERDKLHVQRDQLKAEQLKLQKLKNDLNVSIKGAERTLNAQREAIEVMIQTVNGDRAEFESMKYNIFGVTLGLCVVTGCAGIGYKLFGILQST